VLARVNPQREVLTSAAATALALLGLPAIPAKHGGV
jgi:TetR/AcrR family transcriptional repressor of nem operon